MTIFILVSILLVAALAIALLMGVSPASQKVKVRTMYAGAAPMLVVTLIVCDYIDALPDFPSKFRFHAVLVLTITVGYLCIAIACMEKYNVLKRKNRMLEDALTEKEQEKVSILMERQSEQQQALQKGELNNKHFKKENLNGLPGKSRCSAKRNKKLFLPVPTHLQNMT